MQAFHLLGPAPFYTNSFLLISDAGHAVIIDPAAEVQEYDKILKEHNAQLTTILCTHGHYDHVGSAGTLRREHKARLYCEPVDCRGTQLLPLKAADVDSGYEEGETIAVDELDVVEVAVGQKVKITVDALSDAEMDGEVYKIAPVGSNSGGVTTYDVTVTVSGEDERVKGGMNVSGEIIVNTAEEATMIPTDALQKDDAGYCVTLESGETRRVTLGL